MRDSDGCLIGLRVRLAGGGSVLVAGQRVHALGAGRCPRRHGRTPTR
jgi:hypothetical protein